MRSLRRLIHDCLDSKLLQQPTDEILVHYSACDVLVHFDLGEDGRYRPRWNFDFVHEGHVLLQEAEA